MSDRTPSSVRTGSRTGDTTASKDVAPEEPAEISSTQAIPTTGTQRAQGATGGSTATAGTPVQADQGKGQSSGAAAGAAGPASGSASPAAAGAPPVPPVSTAGPVAPPTAAPAVPAAVPPAGTVTNPAGVSTPTLDPSTASRGRGRPTKSRGPRRARLQLRHIDTWSALKISLVLSIALFFIWMVAVGVLYGVLSALGVFKTVNDLFGQLGSASGSSGGGGEVVTPGVVFGGAAVIGAINIVLMTALCTVGTFIYNLCSDLVGGLELTLSERD